MKAAVAMHFGGPGVLELKDVAEPAVGPRDVLVEVRGAGDSSTPHVANRSRRASAAIVNRGAAATSSFASSRPVLLPGVRGEREGTGIGG